MTMPNQYKFDNLKLGNNNSTVPTQYQFNNLDKPLFGDYDLGGTNAGKNTLGLGEKKSFKDKFADALINTPKLNNSTSNSFTPTYNYQFTPSTVDYSQYMGLSPEAKRYLYGGI